VRSSGSKRPRRSRQLSKPHDWFTPAAVERIASCCFREGPLASASRIISSYLNDEVQHGVGFEEFIYPSDIRFPVQIEHLRALRFYAFAGLVELAVSAGYIDLDAWEELPSFSKALKQFEKHEASEEKANDLTLIRALLARLELKSRKAFDDSVFYSFASYLHLTDSLYRDERCYRFIVESANPQIRKRDLSFLLSARHFAEALATERIAGIFCPDAKIGLETLGYFRWLTEILDRVAGNLEFGDKLIRHAHWSHHIWSVKERFDVWADRMAEWDEVGDNTTRLHLKLRPSWGELSRLGLTDPQSIGPVNARAIAMESERPLAEATRLVDEGRKEAAKQYLRHQARFVDYHLDDSTSDRRHWAVKMVSVCKELAKLGDVDAAAVYLARHVEEFINELGEDDDTTKDALTILAQSRGASESEETPQSDSNIISEPGMVATRSQFIPKSDD
jgi:hypothetical protein